MANPSSKKQDQITVPPFKNLKRALLLTGVSALLVMGVLYFMLWKDPSVPMATISSTPKANTGTPTSEIPKTSHLLGRWLRPDGGYILEIRSATPDGKIDAAYYNPNPIKVGRAEWVAKDDKQYVMVELQDVNYPGSTYGLEYQPSSDHMVGTYYQAVEKNTYEVEFVREK